MSKLVQDGRVTSGYRRSIRVITLKIYIITYIHTYIHTYIYIYIYIYRESN